MVVPSVQGVAPDLTGGGKGIRGTAGDGLRHVLLIQLEELGMDPDIRAVRRYINRDIAYDPNVPFIGVFLDCFPLAEEIVLQVFVELNIEVKMFVIVIQGEAPAHADILGPFLMGDISEEVLQGHEQGVIIQPPGVVRAELNKIRMRAEIGPVVGGPEQFYTVLIHLVVVNGGGIAAPVDLVAFLLRQGAVVNEGLQIYIVGIARKGGISLVGRITGLPVSGGTEGKDLPAGLSRRRQKIYEFICFDRKTAHSVFGRKTADCHQYTSLSFHLTSCLLQFKQFLQWITVFLCSLYSSKNDCAGWISAFSDFRCMIDRLISRIARILALEYTNHMLFFRYLFSDMEKERTKRTRSGRMDSKAPV